VPHNSHGDPRQEDEFRAILKDEEEGKEKRREKRLERAFRCYAPVAVVPVLMAWYNIDMMCATADMINVSPSMLSVIGTKFAAMFA
jgi:hypothetical protein